MKKLLTVAFFFSSACGGTVADGDAGGGDAGKDVVASQDASVDAAVDVVTTPDAGTFCSGTSPRMMINGSEVAVANVSSKAIILNCCDSAELMIATGAFQAMFALLWRAPASSSTSIDVGNPPSAFQIELDLGCDPATTSCATASPEERYASGFQGSINYAYSSAGLTVSYCVSGAESPQSPHTLIHSFQIYAPGVIAQ